MFPLLLKVLASGMNLWRMFLRCKVLKLTEVNVQLDGGGLIGGMRAPTDLPGQLKK